MNDGNMRDSLLVDWQIGFPRASAFNWLNLDIRGICEKINCYMVSLWFLHESLSDYNISDKTKRKVINLYVKKIFITDKLEKS